MADSNQPFNRREFIQGALAGVTIAALPINGFSADNSDMQAVLAEVPKMHDENLKHLQEWIALPSIAAMDMNYPQGPDYMAKLAREAGFENVEIIPTCGQARSVRRAELRRSDHRGPLLHVRREALRSGRVVVAAAGRKTRRQRRA